MVRTQLPCGRFGCHAILVVGIELLHLMPYPGRDCRQNKADNSDALANHCQLSTKPQEYVLHHSVNEHCTAIDNQYPGDDYYQDLKLFWNFITSF